jgi:hypothetical protein
VNGPRDKLNELCLLFVQAGGVDWVNFFVVVVVRARGCGRESGSVGGLSPRCGLCYSGGRGLGREHHRQRRGWRDGVEVDMDVGLLLLASRLVREIFLDNYGSSSLTKLGLATLVGPVLFVFGVRATDTAAAEEEAGEKTAAGRVLAEATGRRGWWLGRGVGGLLLFVVILLGSRLERIVLAGYLLGGRYNGCFDSWSTTALSTDQKLYFLNKRVHTSAAYQRSGSRKRRGMSKNNILCLVLVTVTEVG